MEEIVGKYNFKFIEGDTYSGFGVRISTKEFSNSIDTPVDLSSSNIQMRIQSTTGVRKKYVDLTTYNGKIAITHAADGRFEVLKQKINLPSGLYQYSIQVKFPNGDQKTYVVGDCEVIDNSTASIY